MQYRVLGQTGVQVAALGQGRMGLVGPDQIEEVSIAALHAEVVIASKLDDLEPVRARRQCEEGLQRLRSDYRDLHIGPRMGKAFLNVGGSPRQGDMS